MAGVGVCRELNVGLLGSTARELVEAEVEDGAVRNGVILFLVVGIVGFGSNALTVVVVVVAEVVVVSVAVVVERMPDVDSFDVPTGGELERPVVVTTLVFTLVVLADADVLSVLVETVVVPGLEALLSDVSLTGVEVGKVTIREEFVRVCPAVVMTALAAEGLVAFLVEVAVVGLVVVTDFDALAVVDVVFFTFAIETKRVLVSFFDAEAVVSFACCVAFVIIASTVLVFAGTDDIVVETEDIEEKF